MRTDLLRSVDSGYLRSKATGGHVPEYPQRRVDLVADVLIPSHADGLGDCNDGLGRGEGRFPLTAARTRWQGRTRAASNPHVRQVFPRIRGYRRTSEAI